MFASTYTLGRACGIQLSVSLLGAWPPPARMLTQFVLGLNASTQITDTCFVYELPDPNGGDYLPTRVVVAKDATDVQERMAASDSRSTGSTASGFETGLAPEFDEQGHADMQNGLR
jgi:hypothetical protein